jgi:hypothetical protein
MKITEAGTDSGGIALKKIEWDDGQWWIFRSEVSWGTSREIRKVLMNVIDAADPDVDSAQIIQTLRIIGSTEEWSFKLPIVENSVNRIADWRIRHVLGEMVERQRIEVSTEETKKIFGWLSFLGRLFPRSTQTQ